MYENEPCVQHEHFSEKKETPGVARKTWGGEVRAPLGPVPTPLKTTAIRDELENEALSSNLQPNETTFKCLINKKNLLFSKNRFGGLTGFDL